MNWATKVAKKVNAMKKNIMMKMLAEESAGKKLGFSDLLNKNGGSKTLISVDGKVSSILRSELETMFVLFAGLSERGRKIS